MKKLLSFLAVMFLAVMCSACVNTLAVHELNQAAADYMEKGDPKSAIARLESSVDLDDSIYETRYNLAVAYLEVEDCTRALENIKVAQKLAPKEPTVYYTLGVANSCEAEKYCKAKDENLETLVFDPVDGEKCTQYLKEANSAFEKYLELNPEASDAEEVKASIQNNKYTIEAPKS